MEKKKSVPGEGLYGFLQIFTYSAVLLILLFVFVGRVVAVLGESMLPTLQDGQRLVLQVIGYTPQQGDVVVLAKDSFRQGEVIVKRVIAVGGQSVEIDYNAGAVYVDGEALDEPYCLEPMRAMPEDYLTQVTVPQGGVFVMGDNRNHSGDSRDPTLGVVDLRCVMGKVLFVE